MEPSASKLRRSDPQSPFDKPGRVVTAALTGTVIVTIVPFDDIGRIYVHRPVGIGDGAWTVVVESAHGSFPETLNSPLRQRAMRVSPRPYDHYYKFRLFGFADPADARDAYAYFLHHQQLGHG